LKKYFFKFTIKKGITDEIGLQENYHFLKCFK